MSSRHSCISFVSSRALALDNQISRSRLIILFLLITLFINVNCLHLNGVTLTPQHPRSEVYQNFFHDLINELSDVGQFSYMLREMNDAKYGGEVGELHPQGLIGELYDNNADFILADLEITPERLELVQFTRPFLKSKLAALIQRPKNKEDAAMDANVHQYDEEENVINNNNHTFVTISVKDLKEDNDLKQNYDLHEVLQKHHKRAVIKGSTVERYFKTSKNPLVYQLLPTSFTDLNTALEMVRTNPDFVLISDSIRLSLIAAVNCDLEMITATSTETSDSFGSDYHTEYAIALGMNSPFFGYFENALKIIEETGRLEELVDQYWFDQCAEKRLESNHLKAQKNDEVEANSSESLKLSPLNIIFIFVLLLL